MRLVRCKKTLTVCLLCVASLSAQLVFAQKEKREPLTSAEIEQIREAGVDPVKAASTGNKNNKGWAAR